MLMFMTASREHARESSGLDDGRRMREIPARSPDTIEALVGSSDVPLAAVDLPSGRFLAVNPAIADAVGSTVSALTDSSSLDWLSPDDRHAAQLGFQALADGDLTGYQATRRFADPDQVFSVWVSTVDVDGARVGLTSVILSASLDSQFRALPPVSSVPEPGNVVLGTVDSSWRVDRISKDVTPLLGLTSEQCAGQPVLGVIHPSDVPLLSRGSRTRPPWRARGAAHAPRERKTPRLDRGHGRSRDHRTGRSAPAGVRAHPLRRRR